MRRKNEAEKRKEVSQSKHFKVTHKKYGCQKGQLRDRKGMVFETQDSKVLMLLEWKRMMLILDSVIYIHRDY